MTILAQPASCFSDVPPQYLPPTPQLPSPSPPTLPRYQLTGSLFTSLWLRPPPPRRNSSPFPHLIRPTPYQGLNLLITYSPPSENLHAHKALFTTSLPSTLQRGVLAYNTSNHAPSPVAPMLEVFERVIVLPNNLKFKLPNEAPQGFLYSLSETCL